MLKLAGHLVFNSGSNESRLAPQFKWLEYTFKELVSQKNWPIADSDYGGAVQHSRVT